MRAGESVTIFCFVFVMWRLASRKSALGSSIAIGYSIAISCCGTPPDVRGTCDDAGGAEQRRELRITANEAY
jgi:hypothetical protein